MKTASILATAFVMFLTVATTGCDKKPDVAQEAPAVTNDLRAPVARGGVPDDSVKPIARTGVADDGVKPIAPVGKSGVPDDSVKPVVKTNITPAPVKPGVVVPH